MRGRANGIPTAMALALLLSCSTYGPGVVSRPFAMGFTPWPYAATVEAVAETYAFINAEGDLVAHHFQQGLPFTASDPSDSSTWSPSIREEIDGRIVATAPGKTVYLAVDCLNGDRSGLTDLWSDEANQPRPAPWDGRGFASNEVIETYIGFAAALISRFRDAYGRMPEYFNYAPEISELMLRSPAAFDDFAGAFAPRVFAALRLAFPTLRLMVSLALKDPGGPEMNAVRDGFARIGSCVDVVGISAYGYAFFSHSDRGNPARLPADWLSQIADIAPGKPYAVTETGWIAESLDLPAWSLSARGSAAFQREYVILLLEEAYELGAETVIWFASRDYDVLWRDTLGSDALSRIWRDTGLVDGSGRERPALAVWRAWMALPRD